MTKKTQPRTRANRTVIYKGRVFTVESERAVLPNGMRKTMEIVRHRGSVVLIPQPRRQQVILIRQFRYVLNRWIWELPAGTLEVGERTDRAARRECEEEIGLRPTRITKLGSYYPTPGFCDEELIFYRVSQLRPPAADSPRKPDDDEDIQSQLVTIEEARSMVERGEIIDLKTAYGLTLV